MTQQALIATLRATLVAELRAELEVRTKMYPRPQKRPEEYCKRGFSAAFDSGYEAAWRGQTFSDPYDSNRTPHLWRAYSAGWSMGAKDSRAAIAKVLRREGKWTR